MSVHGKILHHWNLSFLCLVFYLLKTNVGFFCSLFSVGYIWENSTALCDSRLKFFWLSMKQIGNFLKFIWTKDVFTLLFVWKINLCFKFFSKDDCHAIVISKPFFKTWANLIHVIFLPYFKAATLQNRIFNFKFELEHQTLKQQSSCILYHCNKIRENRFSISIQIKWFIWAYPLEISTKGIFLI